MSAAGEPGTGGRIPKGSDEAEVKVSAENPRVIPGTDARSAVEIFRGHFGLAGGDPDIGMLRAVVSHFSNVPYENVTKVIARFELDESDGRLRSPETVMRGFVDERTGGTCFSLTWCLGSILSSSGFRCRPVMADMKRANVHCALLVEAGNGRYLVDPGYLLAEPVELSREAVTVTAPFGRVELRPRGAAQYDLYTVTGGERRWRYRVRTVPVSRAAFFRYWRESFHLPMMNSLQLTRLTGEGHLYIRDHHLRHRTADGKVNENIRADLETRIEREFGIPAGITARAREHLERMKETWRAQKQEARAPRRR